MQVSNKAHTIITNTLQPIHASPNAPKLLPYAIAHYAAQGIGASHVGITLTKVCSCVWISIVHVRRCMCVRVYTCLYMR
ncbi:hypothetical protein EON63_02945 [archaeon]|nr:MAG: hypothetical protein EON63_02945 [archaeon]